MLVLLQDHLPLGKDEWDKVARLHETRYPYQRRNSDSLWGKVSALCRTTVPTGDPLIPPEVLKANAIREEMTERAEIGDAGESEDGYTDKINDETALLKSRSQSRSVDETGSGALLIQENQRGSTTDPPTSNPYISPRPLVRKKSTYNQKTVSEDDNIYSSLKLSMLQEQIRRDEDHRLV